MSHCMITRKVGDSILIDIPPSEKSKKIQINVLGRNGSGIKIGIDAPKECLITRSTTDTNGIINKNLFEEKKNV